MANDAVYIAGLGVSHVDAGISGALSHELAVSAATKAMLDAGVTYEDVKHSVACYLDGDGKISKSTFDVFGKTGTSISEADASSGLFTAIQTIKSGYSDCSLVIGFDKEALHSPVDTQTSGRLSAVGVVLINHKFLTCHAYLKDSSARICASTVVRPKLYRSGSSKSEEVASNQAIRTALQQASLTPDDINLVNAKSASTPDLRKSYGEDSGSGKGNPESVGSAGTTGLLGLCELVWQLRGWARDRAVTGIKYCLQSTTGADGTTYVNVLSRSEGSKALTWEEVQNVRDGRERVGYNPAVENKGISYEDWLAVKARDEHVSEATRKQLSLPVKGGDRAALARL